jgi:hypothetical protein
MPPPPPPGGLTPPPGYVAYGGHGNARGPVQLIGQLTKWLIGLLVAVLVLQVLSLVLQMTLRGSALEVRDGSLTLSDFNGKIGFFVAISGITAAVGLALLVVQIIWTARMAKNMGSLGRQPQTFGVGWTIAINILGGCTLGILNIFMWRDIWKGSDPESPAFDPNWKQQPTGQIVVYHLIATLAAAVLGFALGAAGAISIINTKGSSDVADNLSGRFFFVVAAGLMQIIVSVIFIQLVRQLSARHMKAIGEA